MPTIKERLEDAKANLQAVMEAAEAGEKGADELTAAIEEVEQLQEHAEKADAAQQLIKSLGTNEGPAEKEGTVEFNTLGEFAADAVKGADPHEKFSITTPSFKAAPPMDTPSSISAALTDVDKNLVLNYRRPLLIADLFGSETISGNALTYYVEAADTDNQGSISTVAEGGTKPLISFGDPTDKTVSLQKIAAVMKETDELVADAPWLASAINNRGIYLFELAVENFLLSTLSGTSGIQTGDALTADGIFAAMMDVQAHTGFAADAIVINPADYQTLRLAKDSNNQYYGGGYFYGAYGNTPIAEQPNLWGLRTVVTSAVAQGTCYVGAFRLGGSVVSKGGMSVDIANTNEDDFIKNMIAIRIEQRLALAVRYPAAFVKITASGSTTTE